MKMVLPPEENTFIYEHLDPNKIEKAGYVVSKAEDTIRQNYKQEGKEER